ncbi:MAG: nucleoside monophosphate kinase [Nanoarchaeota archaeon]
MESTLLYGPPASGKTTLAQILTKETGLVYISVGQIVREEIRKKSTNGLLLKKYLDDVVEYPVDLISKVVENRLKKLKSGESFLLDGFPKYYNEAKAFLDIKEKHKLNINNIILIEVPLPQVISRVKNRRICLNCLRQYSIEVDGISRCSKCEILLSKREDDSIDFLIRRYTDYKKSIGKTLKILGSNNFKTTKIDGEKHTLEILHLIKKELIFPK